MNLNHIEGLIYGSLIGDALGIQFEFYKKNLINVNDLTYKPSHFLPIEAGRWSDDGDNILLLLETIIESKDDIIDHKIYAKKLKNWYYNGFKILGDKVGGIGCGNTISAVITNEHFDSDPHLSSKIIYEKTKSNSNGAIMKIAIIGIISDDIEQVIQNTINICKVTHDSMLVIVSCLIITLIVHLSKYNNFLDKSYKPLIFIFQKIKIYINQLTKNELDDLYKYINISKLSEINLDEDFKVSYTLKCMACVIWSINNIYLGYNNILKEIYSYGGDTDTNGCVVGGVIGFILGKSSIDFNWIDNIKHQDFINYNINNLIKKISL